MIVFPQETRGPFQGQVWWAIPGTSLVEVAALPLATNVTEPEEPLQTMVALPRVADSSNLASGSVRATYGGNNHPFPGDEPQSQSGKRSGSGRSSLGVSCLSPREEPAAAVAARFPAESFLDQ